MKNKKEHVRQIIALTSKLNLTCVNLDDFDNCDFTAYDLEIIIQYLELLNKTN